MDLGRPTTTTESRALIGMVQYYRNMWTIRSHILDPLTEADIGLKGRNILWDDDLERYFKEIKHVVSAETVLSYPDLKLLFTVQTDDSYKQLGAVII